MMSHCAQRAGTKAESPAKQGARAMGLKFLVNSYAAVVDLVA